MIPDRWRPCPGSSVAMLLLAMVAPIVLHGCSARLTGQPMSAAQTSDCLEAHRANLERRQQLAGAAGRGRVQFVAEDGRGRASFEFVFRRPDSLRLQFLSPLGPAVALLDLSGDHFLFVDFRQGVYLRGHAGDDDFHRLTGLPFVSPNTLVSVLLAEMLPENDEVGRLRFESNTCLPLSCELGGRLAEPAVTVDFHWAAGAGNHRDDDEGPLLPERVIFTGPHAAQQTTIRFKSVRALTAAEQGLAWDPVDTSGLLPAASDQTDDAGVPRWLD